MTLNCQSVNFLGDNAVTYVDSIADLRLLKPGLNGEVVVTSGGTNIGDGKGGMYVWSDTSSEPDNGVSVIASQYSGSTGRYLLVNMSPAGSYTAPLTLIQNTGTDDALILQGTSSNNKASIAFNSDWEFGESVLNTGELGVYNKKLNSSPLRITPSDNIATFYTNSNIQSQSAFEGAGNALSVNIFNGPSGAPAASSSSGFSVVSNVYNTTEVTDPTALNYKTYSEFSAGYSFLQGFTATNGTENTHVNEHYIGWDNHLITPFTTDATKRAEIVLGHSYYASLFGAGSNLSDDNGRGSFMYSAVTTPLPNSTLEYYGIPDGTATVPFSAMFTACGFNGTPDITDGAQSGALNAADYAFLAGNGGTGLGGSVYLNKGARSKFKVGAQLGDWTDAGLIIGNPIGSQTASGGRQYGIYNPFCTEIGGLMPAGQTTALYVTPSSQGHDGKQVAISIGDSTESGTDGWSIGRDSAKTGENDLFFWSNTAQKNMLWMNDNTIGFFGAVPVVQQGMWVVGSGAATTDIVTALNRITSNLINLGLFVSA